MAYGNFCPGPAHILKPLHPKYSKNTYDQYKNAFPPIHELPAMGAWVVVETARTISSCCAAIPTTGRSTRAGNQLPYLNEMHYRLSTWADRDVQAVAGTGDFSNLEQAENYVEALKRAADPAPRHVSPSAPAPSAIRCIQPLGQWLGRTGCARPGHSRTEPQPRFPQRRYQRSTAAAG